MEPKDWQFPKSSWSVSSEVAPRVRLGDKTSPFCQACPFHGLCHAPFKSSSFVPSLVSLTFTISIILTVNGLGVLVQKSRRACFRDHRKERGERLHCLEQRLHSTAS